MEIARPGCQQESAANTRIRHKGGENDGNNQQLLLTSPKASHGEVTSNASTNCAYFHPLSVYFDGAWLERTEIILKTKQRE